MNTDALPTPPESKADLIARIRQNRSQILTLLSGLNTEQVLRIPGPQKDKNARDLLAHILWWEEFVMFRVLLVRAGEPIQPIKNLDVINAEVYARYQSVPYPAIRQRFETFQGELESFVERLTWEEINGGIDYLGGTVLAVIASNTYEHYAEHVPDLQAFVASLG